MKETHLSHNTIVIGGGQAGLSTGYFLQQQGRDFLILDGSRRIGDAWRNRWDSLRLFTPARADGLAGMPFPAPRHYFPTKDEMADYLEAYAAHFELPIETGVRVDHLAKPGRRFLISAGERRYTADNVVVAMGSFQKPRVPSLAAQLDPAIVQLHSSEYRNPAQLREGSVLVVGAGNSGAEIALDVAPHHPTWLAGRDTGHLPFRVEGLAARLFLMWLVGRVLFHRVLTVKTPIGRKVRPRFMSQGMTLVRTKPEDITAAGIERSYSRVTAVSGGQPVLDNGRVLDVANVIWCTGFQPGFSWIDLPVMGPQEPLHERGVVPAVPGLYFVGLHFQTAVSSGQIHGIARDASYIAEQIAARDGSRTTAAEAAMFDNSAAPLAG